MVKMQEWNILVEEAWASEENPVVAGPGTHP